MRVELSAAKPDGRCSANHGNLEHPALRYLPREAQRAILERITRVPVDCELSWNAGAPLVGIRAAHPARPHSPGVMWAAISPCHPTHCDRQSGPAL